MAVLNLIDINPSLDYFISCLSSRSSNTNGYAKLKEDVGVLIEAKSVYEKFICTEFNCDVSDVLKMSLEYLKKNYDIDIVDVISEEEFISIKRQIEIKNLGI